MAKNWWDEQPKTPTGSLASLQPTVQPLSVPSAPAALPAFDSAAANNPYAAQLAQGLQAYRNRPSRFSTEPASLPAPAQPPEADKPAFDLGNSLSALYEGATEQFIPGVKSALAQAYTGLERPDRNPEWATRFMEEGRQAQQQADQRTAELQRQGQSDSTSEAIRSAIPSLGFSLGSMAAAIPAGLAGAAATQAAIPIPGSGLVGGALAAGAASGVAGYRMAGSQFLNDTFAQMEQESQKQRGRGLTEQEKATAYQELRPVAENTGLWEAGPEAIGNAAMLGLGRVALGLMPKAAMQNLAASALGRAGVRTGAAAGALATEVGTEGVTQFAQGNDQQKGQAAVDALLSGKDMKTAMAAVDPQYQGFQGLVQSTKDVAPATIATVLLMGGLAKPGHMAYSAIRDRREGNARVEDATQATADLRANLEFAREDDITTALTGFDQIETSGTLPKAAAKRMDAARQQLIEELSLRAAPDALNEPLDTRRGQAGYLGFADRANELNDDQVFEAAQRPLPQDAPAELQDARARYGQEAKRRQDLNLAAAHFDQNPEAVAGVAKVLADIGGGKPLNKGGHGSVDYNLSSLSDDMLARYRMAGTVLLRDHAETLGNRAEKLNQTLALLSEETERRASGQRRDPQAIREADIAQKIAKGEKNAKKLLTGLSPDAMERMASGLESRSQLEPGLADTAREIRALANKERARLFNPQGAKQPGIQSALRGWNQNQPNMPAPQGQSLDQQIAADRARLSEIAQQQLERQRQEKLADRTQAIQQQEADRRERLNAEIATRGRPGLAELARLLGPDTQLPAPRQEAPAPQSLSDLLNRPSQSSAVPTARAGERGSLSDLFPQNRNWWDTELSPSKAATETPAPPKSGWTRFDNETGTLNIPRAEMPQVKAEHRGALVNFLNARGVTHEADTEVDPATLKPTQAEFSPQKVRKAINYQGGDRSILVSSDGYVLDGHHQWLAALEQGKPIKAIRLDAPIANLLPLTREFPSSTVSKASNVRGGQTGRVETPTTAAPTQPETPSNETRKAEAEAAPLLNQGTANPYRSPEDRDAAIGRLEEAARTHDNRAVRERAAVIGDAVRMGATEEELQAAIDAGDGDAIEAIADRQYQKTGGLMQGFGTASSKSVIYGDGKPKEPHPADSYRNWEKLTDDQVNAFAKAAGIKPRKTRIGTLDRIDELARADIRKAWDDAMASADQPTPSIKVVRRDQISDATIRHYLSNGMFVDEETVKSGNPMKFMVYAPGQGPRGIALAIGGGKTLKEAISKAAADQPTKKKPADLILWGYKPGTSDVPIKLGPFSKAEQSRREKDGWKTAAYAKGDEPTGLREQAQKEAAKAPAPTAKGAAPLWNRANEAERIALLRQPSGPSGSSVSEDFARRKAAEWKTWADIPEGPAKSRLREALKNEDISRENWWDKELTRKGRENALVAAGLRLDYDQVKWRYLKDDVRARLARIIGTDRDPAIAEPASPQTQNITNTPAGPATTRPAGPGTTAIELPVGAGERPAPQAATDYGKSNTIFTEDAAAKARAILKAKLGQLSAGIDPEIIQAGITLAGYHIEAGAREFSAYAKAMLADLGEQARPFLRSWYEGVRHYPGFSNDGMTASSELDADEAAPSPQKKSTEATIPKPPTAVQLDDGSTIKDSTNEPATDQGKQPGVGAVAPRRSETTPGRREGGRPEPSATGGTAADLATEPSANVEAPEGENPRPSARNRATGPVSQGTSETPEGGNGATRRSGTGNGGLATDDAGRTGSTGTELKNGGVSDSAPVITYPNYHISDPKALVGGGPKARFNKNRKAIETWKELTETGLQPTPEQLDALAAYTGWGSFGQELFQGTFEHPRPKPGWADESQWMRDTLGKSEWESAQRSILNAHYTDPPTVNAMWNLARKLGFSGGRVLEPSMGIGNFFGLMPRDIMGASQLTGIELDEMTAGMAQRLYPDAIVRQMGYQDSKTADHFYDLVIGNWPFARQGPIDRRYRALSPSLHDYFFLKAVDQVRPGGLVIGVTSAFTMDKKGEGIRRELAKKAELVAAFRLPTGAFEDYAGTKVVTDIIILKKRDTPLQSVNDESWVRLGATTAPSGAELSVNQYYIEHPDQVLGVMDIGRGTTTGAPGLIVNRPDRYGEMLSQIADRVDAGIYEPRTTREVTRYLNEETKDRQQSATIGNDGQLYQVQGDRLASLEDVQPYAVKSDQQTADRAAQIRGLIALRRQTNALFAAERDATVGDARVEELRADLKKGYQDFVAKHGPVNESFGLRYLNKLGDPYQADLAALETWNGKEWKPATALNRPTTRGKKTMERPSVADALVLARNERSDIDIARIAELANTTPDKASNTLLESGAIFQAPDGRYEVADQYLSGNVRRKLREARAAKADGVEGMDRNIAALEQVIPKTVPYYNIEARMGAPWVPVEDYGDFVKELLGANTESDGLPISFIAGRWKVGNSAMFSMAQGTPWQTNDVSFRSLLSAALNVRTLTVKRFDPVDKTTYVDEAATKEANQKVADLREAFTTWLWKTPDRQVRLEKVYNEIMNAMAAPEFDGSFLNFEGMALQRGQQPFNLRQHQIDAIYRGIANRRGLYAHEVGTGKTYTIAGVAVESRRYGLSRKPLILAHNANSKAVADGIVEMYPNAKVLYINNLDSKSIETKLRQIKMDDWDAVVVPHSLIERFALTRETLMDLAQEQIDALEEEAYTAAEEDMGAHGERLVDLALDGDESAFKKLRSPSAKDLVRARNQIIAKIEDHAQRASREGAVPFEELGIDSIIVDEAHLFKKPPLETRMKMRGLNTATSNRGLAMSFLTNYIKKINGGKGVHLFTGTPITNTLSETFHMMRYVMDDEMRRDGLQNWDGWFNTFASETNDIEITAAGEYEPVTRLASFINVADLRRMMAPYTDIVFADDMPEFKPRKTRSGKTMADTLTDSERAELLQGRDEEAVGRPYKKVVVDSAEMTPDQAAIMALLTERARRFRAASRKERREIMLSGSPESPLLVETAAANAGLDQRLFKEKAYEGSPNSKAARAVRNLLTHYREHPKTTQVVFMERGFEKSGFNLAKSIVDDLVAGGIPRKEIAIVDGSTSADRRKAVADAMNRAEIRVVIGNTQTLGVGVNMQANLRAMHHLDAPWTPADLEQRNGRGHRQGNAWNTVMEYRYLTERIDGRRWQVLAVKDRFIKSFLKADENTRVIEGDAVDDSNQSDIVSTLSEAAGDPRILIINKLKADLEKLHARERMHGRAVVDAKREIDHKLQRESAIQARRDAYQRYQEVAEKAKQSEEPAYLIDGTKYADRKDAQTALDEFISRKAEPTGTSPKKIGHVYGLDLSYMWSGTQSMGPIFYVGSKGSPLIDMGRATILSAENAVWSLPRRIKEEGDELSENQRAVENLRRVVREPFGRAEELKRKADQLQRVEQDVQNNPVPPPGWLRNGAPVDSVAYHQGKPYVVTGHRWTAVNYSVELQSDDGKTQRVVPYDEVTDAQNIPLYEPHPFVAPDVAEKNRESRPTRGSSSATPITPAQTRADLSRTLGADVVARLEQSGRLVIHDKPPTGAAAGAQGWVDQKGVIHLVPANLESSALSVLLHESAHLMRDDRFSPESRALGRAAHAVLRMSGLQGLIGNPSYNDLIQQVYRLAAEGNKTAQAALAKATVEPGNTAEEALSYIVEYADEKLPLYRRIMSAIRAALYRLGIKVKLTPADLRALALSALKSRANEVTARNAQPAFSLPDFAPTEADRVEVERQMKAVKEVRDDQGNLLAPNGKPSKLNERQWKQVRTQFFKDWFGDWQNDPDNASKVVDENGEPMVVYHGSPDARFMSSDATFKSQAERYGFGSPIGVHWFASSEQTAKTYADERRAFDYQNAEPGIVAAFLNIRDAIEINANGQKWREAQKVGKTSSVIDKAQTEGRDGVIIENVKDDYQTGAIKGSRATTTFSVFSSAQIKSAIGNAGTFSPRSNRIDYSQAADEAEQDQLWREFQAVRAQFQERQASQSAFERWFGQGVEGVNVHKGKPLTLFHGTNNPEFNRWDESLSGQASRHPTAGLGFFMTADARSAARYGSRLLELNAKINKPYFMTDADLTSIEDTQDAARFRRKLQAQGYDAAVIVAPGAAPYVVAFQSSQVKLTSNTTPTESEDFRYSLPGRPPNLNSPRVAARVMDDIGGVMNDLKPGEKPLAKANPRNFAQMLTDLKANTRPQWLGLLTRNMQLELAREVLPRPMVEQFENAAEAMDAAESKMIQREAFPLADRWQALIRKHREQADRLARSLYMATWTGTDPRQPMPTKKRAEWIRTKAAYDGLTDPEAKKLFSEVLGFYQGQTERLFKELQNRIDRHSLPAADKLAAKDMLRQEFERMKDDGPYVPLMRFGDLTVFAEARTAGEKPVFATFETVQDQRAFADWLKKEGYQPQLGVKTEEVAKRALPQGDFVGKLAGIIDKTTQGPEGQVLKDAMYQLFLRSLPEQAIRKHFIHRRFVPGYTADALRTFATFGRRSAKQIARLAHSDRMSDALEAMAKANREGQTQDPVSAGHLINELEKSFQWAMNPGTNALSSRLTHLGFLWHLGASPAHLLLNLSQQAQVTFPWLAGEMHGKIGSGSVAAALANANKDFIASNPFTSADKRGAAAKKRRSDLEGEFNGDMGRALKALEESGKTDKTQTYSLSGLSEEDSWLWSKPYLRKFTEGAAWFFHVAEVINREASAIAAYRLARRAGMSHEQGYDLARRAINETHFDYSPANRARFMRGNVAKVLTLFKQYSLNISWQLGRNTYLWARGGSKAEKAQARTKLLGMLGMTMVMAGAAGMPFYGEIMWLLTQLLNATRDDDEPEWDADTEFRSLLDRAFGETGDEAVRHGLINAFMGIDVSSRIKLDDLWWRPIGDDADGKKLAYQMMEQALGPVAGLFVRGVATADGLVESLVAGDNARGASWRAIEGSLPKALKDISRSIRYAEEGATTFQGATLLPADRISALAKLGQAMGFVPAELAERYSENRAMKSLERRILTRRRALLDTVAMGLLSQDDEVVRAASEDIAAFNRRYPTVAITGDTISKSLRGRLRAKIETEAAGGARLDKRLAGMLLEGMR